jgi:biopolymer transport protein ExbB/TolQ
MEINLWELWTHMGLPVRSVVLLLTVQAMGCVYVVIDRFRVLKQSNDRAREFVVSVQPAMDAHDYGRVLQQASETPPNHLTSFLEMGLRVFLENVQGGEAPKEAAENARRALERKGDIISRDINKGMNIIASTGSTAPFVGLLGTVLGIIGAFKQIAATGSGGIGTIGGAIGESLIVTGYGLVVAIPAVLVFNWLSARIANYEAGLINAGAELVDRLQAAWRGAALAAAHQQQQAAARPASSAPPARVGAPIPAR